MSDLKPVIDTARVVANKALSRETFLLTVKAASLIKGAEPGRFVKIRAWDENHGVGGGPFLDRPFSIHHINGDELSLLYRVVGLGTSIISRLAPDTNIKISGPLGSSLSELMTKQAGEKIYLVAGGIGLAPMRLAMDWMGGPDNASLFYGERAGNLQVDENWLSSWAGAFKALTEDGSGYGAKGLVTAPLAEALKKEPRPVFACGPQAMLAAVAKIAVQSGVSPWVSVEAGMACGFGVCLTCSLPLTDGGRFRACREGPVVDGGKVDWNKR